MMSVLDGSTDAYVQVASTNGTPAPVIARSAGLFTSRVDGSALVCNQRNVLLPDLIVCRPELAEQVLAAVAPLDLMV